MRNILLSKLQLLLLLAFCWAPLAWAAPATVEVTGQKNAEFSRILFQGDATSQFSASLQGNTLVLTLSEPIQANFRSMLGALKDQVSSATLEGGGKRIVIRLKDSGLRIRKFRGQSVYGVDLVPLEKSEKKPEPTTPQNVLPLPAKKSPEKKPEAAKPESKKKEEKKKEPVKKEEKKKVEKKEEKRPETKEAKKETRKPEPKPEKRQIAPPPAETKLKPMPAVPVKKVDDAEVRALIQQPEEVTRVMPTQATKLFTVPWDKLVSAAIYRRGNALWMVFDRPSVVPVLEFTRPFVTSAEQLRDRQYTIVRLGLTQEVAENHDWIWATREQNDWVVYYGRPPQEKPILITTPEDTGQNEIKLVVRHAGDAFNLVDPDSGEALFVVPVRDPGNRVLPGRRFVELEALATVQGIAIVRRSDVPEYRISREGVSITSKEPFFTSPLVSGKPAAVRETPKGDLAKNTMYPFAHETNPLDFMPTYYSLLKEALSEPEATRSQVRLKMAEHFFLNQFYAESLGLLRDILVDDPEFAKQRGIRPMIAGNLFMMGRYAQAQDAFASILESKDLPEYADEQKLWRWASSRMQDQQNLIVAKPEEGFDIAKALNSYLPSYPYALRRKLLLLFIEEQLADKRIGVAREVIKQVAGLHPEPEEAETLDLMEARALLIEEKNDLALERLTNIQKNATSARVRTLALLARTDLEKQIGARTLPELIEQLEKGRLEWRGDGVEFGLLNRLGTYYIENKQYIEGLRVWRELVTEFSGTTAALEVSSEMAGTFARLFEKDGAAYKLEPLKALSIFFEFNELLPVGEKGDQISRLLADYLASVDLLENAAAILTHQVRFRSQGADRAELATKLIDLHLANNRPDLALEVFSAMENEKIPPALAERFKLLRLETILQNGDYKTAQKMLEAESAPAFTPLKLALYWKQEEWEKAIALMEPEVMGRAKRLDTLSLSEEERALRLAIAYSKLRRFDDLKKLREAYGKRIKTPEIGDALDFVTDSTTPIDHKALEGSLEMDKFKSFLGKYKLPEPPAPPPAPAPTPAASPEPVAAPAEKQEETKE